MTGSRRIEEEEKTKALRTLVLMRAAAKIVLRHLTIELNQGRCCLLCWKFCRHCLLPLICIIAIFSLLHLFLSFLLTLTSYICNLFLCLRAASQHPIICCEFQSESQKISVFFLTLKEDSPNLKPCTLPSRSGMCLPLERSK